MKHSKALQLAVALFVLLLSGAALAAGSIDEGIEYKRISPPQPTDSGDKIEVIEMFWYGCPHCFHFEPRLNEWLQKQKPANVVFKRIPADFNGRWETLARAYYTAKVLGVADRVHEDLFNAIHVKGKRMDSEAQLADFFAAHGVPRDKFKGAFHSFAVDAKVRRAQDLTRRYGIDGVPALIIDGKYRTDATMAGSQAAMIDVLNYLIKKESSQESASR